MKTILAAVLLFASTAMGDWGGEPTWRELQADPNIEIFWPTWNGIHVNDLCVSGDEFRTTRPVRYCAEQVVVKREACNNSGEAEFCREIRKGDRVYPSEVIRETYGCGEYRNSSDLRMARGYEGKECVRWSESRGETGMLECLEERTVKSLAPTTYLVPYKDRRHSSGEAYELKHKKYTIGSCGK